MSRLAAPILLAVATLIALSLLGARHPFGTYGTETDFYHLYAPDASRLAAGEFPQNTFQGPGYPLVLAVVRAVAGDLFVAGKWISIASASLAVFFVALIFQRLGGVSCGIGAGVLLLLSPVFGVYGVSATTDVFFLMLSLAMLAVLTAERPSPNWRAAIAAAIGGFAYLTRYNGIAVIAAVLLAVIVFDLFVEPMRRRLTLAGLFIVVFTAAASPWLIVNAAHHRSPFFNTNYLNIATEFFPEKSGGRFDQDGTRAAAVHFHSFRDLISADPFRIARRYPEKLWNAIRQSAVALLPQWIALVALGGAAIALTRRERMARLLIAAMIAHLLLLALTHWETRYFFLVGALLGGFASYAAVCIGTRYKRSGSIAAFAVLSAMALASFARSRAEVERFLASHPVEVMAACEQLQQHGIRGARIVARKPHLSALCNQQWVFFPDVASPEELRVWLAASHVDYLAFGIAEAGSRPGLAPLLDPRNAPPWLQPVWANRGRPYVLYRPNVPR